MKEKLINIMVWLVILAVVGLIGGVLIEASNAPSAPVTQEISAVAHFPGQEIYRLIDTIPETGTVVICYGAYRTGMACLTDPARDPAVAR